MLCNCCKPVLFILLQCVHSGMCCTSRGPSEDFSTQIQRLQDKKSCDKQKKALFNLMWLTFESQSPTDNLRTPGFLWCAVCCEGTQNLWYLDYFIYVTLVLQLYLFYFLWMKWSHCSFLAINVGRDLWSNVTIWVVFILTKTSRKSFTLLLIVVCLKLLNQEYIQLLPKCENFGVFPDLSFCSEIPYNFSHVGWVFNCLALSSGSICSCCGLIWITDANPCQILLLAT